MKIRKTLLGSALAIALVLVPSVASANSRKQVHPARQEVARAGRVSAYKAKKHVNLKNKAHKHEIRVSIPGTMKHTQIRKNRGILKAHAKHRHISHRYTSKHPVAIKHGIRHHSHKYAVKRYRRKSVRTHIAKRSYAKLYKYGEYIGDTGYATTKHDVMKQSLLLRHSSAFRRGYIKKGAGYSEAEEPARKAKQISFNVRAMTDYSKQSRNYRAGWYMNQMPVQHLHHNKQYRRGFRDSVYVEYGLKAPVKSYYSEFMDYGKIKD